MKITLKTFANIRDVVGTESLALELTPGATLTDLFSHLESTYGDMFQRQVRDQTTGRIVPFLILINDQTFRTTTDMATALSNGDVVTILVPFDGG